jgi:exodeoxyribonuclease VIII
MNATCNQEIEAAEVASRATSLIRYDLAAEDYHAPVLGVASKSALDQIDRSAAHYRQWLTTPREKTPAMRIGSLAHLYILELPKALATVAVVPDFGDCRKTSNKEAKASWLAENAGKELVSQDEWDQIRGMGESVLKHPIARRLIDQCRPEASIFWADPETELECKARVDGWVEPLRIVLDLKTTANASPVEFAKSCHNWRYHVQNALYSDGIAAVTGTAPKAFLFLVVEKEPPYAVATYQLDELSIELGREEYRRNMRTLRECLDNDDWPAYGTATQTISLPSYAFKGK